MFWPDSISDEAWIILLLLFLGGFFLISLFLVWLVYRIAIANRGSLLRDRREVRVD
ncbi:MAG: hypothetical protein ACI9NQ_001682 [Paracoccaceae bacterium]|jgi:hypothetical protein